MRENIETRRKLRAFALALVMALSVMTAGVAMSGTAAANHSSPGNITVGDNGDYQSIQAAIDHAGPGDTIEVSPGTYDEVINPTNDDLVIVAPSGATIAPSQSTLDASGRNRIVDLGWSGGENITFEGFEVVGPSGKNADESSEVVIGIKANTGSTVRDNIVRGVTTAIQDGGSDGSVINDNTVEDSQVGVSILKANTEVTNNDITVVSGTYAEGIGVTGGLNGLVISSNDVDTPDGVYDVGYYGASPATDEVRSIFNNNANVDEIADKTTSDVYKRSIHNVDQDTYHATIQNAIDAASDGDTVEVGPGTYSESVAINTPNVTLVGPNAGTPAYSDQRGDEAVIDAGGADFGVQVQSGLGDLTVDGFAVEGWTVGGVGQGMGDSDGTSVHFLNNDIDVSSPPGQHGNSIQITGDDSTVVGNDVEVTGYNDATITDWATSGILAEGVSDSLIADNHVRYVDTGDVGLYKRGIVVEGRESGTWNGPSDENTVRNNTVVGLTTGIGVQLLANNTVVEENTIRGNDVGLAVRSYQTVGENNLLSSKVPNGTDVTGNDFADNDHQVYDPAEDLNITKVIGINSFDKAIVVEGSGPYEPVVWSSIQDGVDAVNDDDDVVHVGPGTYEEDVTVDRHMELQGHSDPVIDGRVEITGDLVQFRGFTVTNPDEGTGIFVTGSSGSVHDVTVKDVGTNYGGAAQGIYLQGVVNHTSVTDSVITDVGNFESTGSNKGIFVGDSAETEDSGGITIDNVTISEVHADTTVGYSEGGRGAYGILVNRGSGTNERPATEDVLVTNSRISGLTGYWVHAIGLESNTPGAFVTGNEISHLDASKEAPFDDETAVWFEYNPDGESVTVEGNQFRDGVSVGVGVHPDRKVGIGTVDATRNYWGHASGPEGKGAGVFGDVEHFPFYLDAAMTGLAERAAAGDLQDDPEDANNATADVEVDENTSVSVKVPKNSGASKVSVVESEKSTAPKNVTDSDGNSKNAIYMDISADTDVSDEVTITVNKSITVLENRGIDPQNAAINHFNETSQEWEELDTSVEIGGDRALLTATSKGLSPFAITEKETQPTSGGDTRSGGSSSSRSDDAGTIASASGSARASVTSVGRELSVTVEGASPGDSVSVQRDVEEVAQEIRRHGAAVASIAVTFEEQTDLDLTVTSSTNKPDASIPDPPSDRGTVGYVNVEHSTADAVGEVRFGFRVTQERLDEKGIARDEVVLYRYSDDGEWTGLETEFVAAEDDGTLRFEAVSPGLSVFAIGGPQAQQEEPTEAPGEDATPEPTESDQSTPGADDEPEQIEEPGGFPWTTVLLAIGLAILVVGLFVLARRRT